MTFPVDRINDILAAPENFRLEERAPLTIPGNAYPTLAPAVGDEIPITIIDLETTGLYPESDKILQLAMLRILWSPSQCHIQSIERSFSDYEDPEIPIPEFITELNGINQDMVAGQRIDDSIVEDWFSTSELIIAHNAAFDRGFMDKRFDCSTHAPWGCSRDDIQWRKNFQLPARSLEYIISRLGYFYSAHEALTDCLAVAQLFVEKPKALQELITKSAERA